MSKARSAQRGRGANIPLIGLLLAAMLAGFSSALAQDSAGWRAYQPPVAGQPAPNCEFGGSQPAVVDADQWARLKLKYERHCYKEAETLIRRRLRLLTTVRPSPPVGKTGNSTRQQRLVTLKLLARAIEDMPKASSSVAVDDGASALFSLAPTASGNVAEIASDGTDSSPLKDARFYLERGIASYRDGDLPAAIADFDLAIQRDPSLEDAYINQGIAWYRVGSFSRAFDDIARAARIDNSH